MGGNIFPKLPLRLGDSSYFGIYQAGTYWMSCFLRQVMFLSPCEAGDLVLHYLQRRFSAQYADSGAMWWPWQRGWGHFTWKEQALIYNIFVYIYIFICICIYIYSYVYVYIFICIYMYIYIFICICIYISIHILIDINTYSTLDCIALHHITSHRIASHTYHTHTHTHK